MLTQRPADAELLAQLGGDTAVGEGRLARATGMRWTEPRVADGALHLAFPPPPPGGPRSVYVLETLRAEAAHDSLLSIASNGGTVVWLNGELLGASRFADRPARAHQDIYTAPLRQGTNFLLYRVLVNGVEAQLHREWHPQASLPDLLAAAIDLGAYADWRDPERIAVNVDTVYRELRGGGEPASPVELFGRMAELARS